MTTTRTRSRRRFSAALASVIALGGLVALAPTAQAAQTGTPVADSGTAVWGISDYLNSGNPGRPGPAASAYTAPATFDATSKLSTFAGGNATGTVAADGSATLAYHGATVNWAAGTGNGWIRFADPVVTVDATGTGTVTAEVSYGTTPDGVTWTTTGQVRAPQRITIETLSPDSEVGDATYPTSLSNLTYAFTATGAKYTWSNLIGRWSSDLITYLAGDAAADPAIPGWTFKSTVVNNVVSNVVRYPAALNLTLDRTVAATTVTPSLTQDGIVLAVNGTGFKKTFPGVYVSLRERTAGDAAYAGESLSMDAPTAWVSNLASDVGPDPATQANASIDDDGAFSVPITVTKDEIATLDAAKTYTLVTRKAHGMGASPANADQISETPVDIAALITQAQARKDTTVTATADPVTAGGTASAEITVAAASGTPDGTVTIKDGANVVDTGVLLDTGKVTLSVPNQAVGTKQYAVEYSGSNGFWTSTGTLDVTVTKQASAITVAGPATAAYRTATTYTATVSHGSGNVTITGAGSTYVRPIVSGKATFVLPATLAAGKRTLTFAYGGDGTTAAATSVSKPITIAKGAAKIGASVLRKATAKKAGRVAIAVASVKGGPVPTGKVTFTFSKGGVVRTATGTLSNGRLVLTLPKVGKGSWVLKATYTGSMQHSAVSRSFTIKVAKK